MKLNAILIYQPDTRKKEIHDCIYSLDIIGLVTTQILSPQTYKVIFNEILYKQPDLLIFVKSHKNEDVREFISSVSLSISIPSLILIDKEETQVQRKNLSLLRQIEMVELKSDDKYLANILPLRMAKLITNHITKFENRGNVKTLRKLKKPKEEPLEAEEKKVSYLAISNQRNNTGFERKLGLFQPSTNKLLPGDASKEFDKIILIGASAGGPGAITDILKYLPSEFPPIVITQHIADNFVSLFVSRLDSLSQLKVLLAEDGDVIKTNHVYVAPGDQHIKFDKINKWSRILLSDSKPINQARPSVDVMFASAARVFGSNIIAVMLTGTGYDGLNGTKEIKNAGGYIIAQNEQSSTAYGMNKAVIEADLPDKIVDISIMASTLMKIIRKDRISRKAEMKLDRV